MYKIFIVEDDRTIVDMMTAQLGKWGYEAKGAVNFDNVLQEFLSFQPQLVLMDISLPFFNGYYWCGEIRKCSKVPIIFVSSHTDNMDIVMAVNMGGDDYVTKPFSIEVLVAKVTAVIRRTYSYVGEVHVLSAGNTVLNAEEGVLHIGNEGVELTKNECRILKILFEKKDRIVSRESIMQRLWDSDSFIDDNTLTVNINRLRKKLSDYGQEGLIVTKKGQGYMVHGE